ncbi:TPA: DUF3290 domain-containing protein [Klebsiella variicola]|jgi:Protein of unknown function (DUF3290).|uniref:DUF3290 domain-containing protein n=2 Tax=Klebsiella michiganensis TaxID=1134687 RepID=A0AB35Q4T6_9ENTR|nr:MULTISPECIES: DUF3290 domain-containing protein [Klebsiella]AVE77162.1 DUF3290 domain-containing protein [Klebsiella oxytoca]NIG81142.1 DUF3290 domain-containing protein [Klebsiella sp. Ap-873]HBY4297737.1 DUF3290 domain-containing protein [Klebsiella pneumoniae]HCD1319829.1 DUF3290 domain-containing protein [Klebsiella variicola subsp. variicola]KKY78074.1 hypothetical protein OA42_00400 [Klebsiella michiganensis]
MRFYGIDYLQMQSNINDYLKYIVIFSALFILIVVFSLYMRHRLQTKYRDLTIIAFLFLLFISGVQYADYTDSQNIHSQSSQMVNFIRLLSQKKGVNVNSIFSSSIQLSDGIIVKINDFYYRVNLSLDQKTYSLVEVSLVTPDIEIVKN